MNADDERSSVLIARPDRRDRHENRQYVQTESTGATDLYRPAGDRGERDAEPVFSKLRLKPCPQPANPKSGANNAIKLTENNKTVVAR